MRQIHKEVPMAIPRGKQKLWNLAVCKWKWDGQQKLWTLAVCKWKWDGQQLVECKWLSAEEHEE